MNKAQAKARIIKLRELIEDYRYYYHVLDQSIMTDEAADSLKHELAKLEEQYPELITSDSPTQRVAGQVLPGFKSVPHSERMLSLNDVFTHQEVATWQDRIKKLLSADKLEYFVDIKMDGLACALVYEDGQLTQGITRGDGYVGEDVTVNIRTIESIPLRLRETKDTIKLVNGRCEIRGEIVMYKKDFKKLNDQRKKQGLPEFANPRNTAAGTIRQLDPKLVADRVLHFRAYDIVVKPNNHLKTNQQVYAALRELGFLVNAMSKVFTNLDEIYAFADSWQEKRKTLPFNTDGLVIKINDRSLYQKAGITGKAPRGAIAYKYAAEQATTKVKDIFVSIGRTGSATPVAMLEPVVIAGSTVQMATLHNESEVHKKDIRIGDTVIVHKAGDIIPEVVEPLVKLRDGSERKFVMPKNCPDCAKPLAKYNLKDAAWRCMNNACPSRMWKQIEHYASKEALDIEGLGEKNVIALLDAQLISDQADIYQLKEEEVVKLDRFAEVSAHKLVAAIQAKKSPELNRFIYGLGIRHIGAQTAIDLANHFKNIESLEHASIDELTEVEGIGAIVAESVVEWFSEPKNQKLLAKFKKLGVWPKTTRPASGPLKGTKIVITGSLDSMAREEAAVKIRSLGGAFQTTVGKDTDILVVGQNVGENKLEKAQQLKIKQISEADFLRMIKA
ncbi:MAG: NAD-dependent DNA ligase LigA [Candidatus Saccharimonadales bacterium]